MEAETKQREEMEEMIQQRVAVERQNMEEEQRLTMEHMIQQRIEAERQRIEEENLLRMDQMFQYMQNFASSMGQALPPPLMLFPSPQPPTTTVSHLTPYTAD